ncbi:hypothetical protein BHUM_01375 [Candidatus Burkholderia humilis]|nr:hypothetical protein BHUM_01375 [Candidatus Burkholderia humilis]
MSDPARFLGVTVPKDALAQAKEVLSKFSLQLNRPVIVSEYSVTEAQARADGFTVPAGNDSAYSKPAALERAKWLSTAIDTASQKWVRRSGSTTRQSLSRKS